MGAEDLLRSESIEIIYEGEGEEEPPPPGPEMLFKVPSMSELSTRITVVILTLYLCSLIVSLFKENKNLARLTKYLLIGNIIFLLVGYLTALIEEFFDDHDQLTFDMNTVELFDLRLPIMIHAGYKLYHRHFFSQFLDIFVYGILGTFLLILVTSLINKPLLSAIFGKDCDFTLSQMVMFSCISVIVDPMAIRSLKPDNKMFYLLLGVSVFGNSTAVDLFGPASRLAYVSNNTVPATTYGYLALNSLLDLLCGLLLAVAVGLLSSYLSKMARRGDKDCHYYEPGIAVGGTCLVYYMTSYFTLSTLFSVVTCCLLQQRYVFGNFSMKSVMAIEDGLENLAMLFDSLFFIIIGYFLKQVAVIEVWRQVLVLLAVSYLMKAVICLLLAFLLNISRKTPVREILRTVVIMVFAGSRGPRGWALMMTFQGGEHFNFFQDTLLLMLTFSIMLETLIARTVWKKMEEMSDKEEEVEEDVSGGFVKRLIDAEKELHSLLVSGDYDQRKRQLEIAQHIKKMEQHSFHKD